MGEIENLLVSLGSGQEGGEGHEEENPEGQYLLHDDVQNSGVRKKGSLPMVN